MPRKGFVSLKDIDIGPHDVLITDPNGIKYKANEVLTVTKVMKLFDRSRLNIFQWLGSNVYDTYPNGKFPNAFRDKKYNRIIVPINDIKFFLENEYL